MIRMRSGHRLEAHIRAYAQTDRHTGTHMHAHIYIHTHRGHACMYACTHKQHSHSYTHFSLMDPETWSEVSQIKSRT